MHENELVTQALDICFWIHKKYGPGLFESVYERIFCYEWEKTGILYERQKAIPVMYKGEALECSFRADIILDNKVILEIKSVEAFADIHYKQLTTYLKLTNLRLGVLVKFNVAYLKHGIHRIANKL